MPVIFMIHIASKSRSTIKVISGTITLTIRFSDNVTGNLHLLRRFVTKSDDAVEIIYVVYKLKQRNSAVCYEYSYNATGCNLRLIVFAKWNGVV